MVKPRLPLLVGRLPNIILNSTFMCKDHFYFKLGHTDVKLQCSMATVVQPLDMPLFRRT